MLNKHRQTENDKCYYLIIHTPNKIFKIKLVTYNIYIKICF